MPPAPPSNVPQRAQELAQNGRVAEAYELLQSAIARGDGAAAAALAEWRMYGDFIRRDLGLSRELYGRAGALGVAEAQLTYINLLANGAGGTERAWQRALTLLREVADRDLNARAQLVLIERMPLDDDGNPAALPTRETLSAAPRIERLPALLTPDECDYLVRRATPLLQPSVVIHPVSGQFVLNPIRTSTAAIFPFVIEDPVLHAINRRIAAATGTSYEQGEPVQVLSYTAGQEYKLHSDALRPGENQRIKTLLVYLNEEFEGGETNFPQAGLAYRGKRGDALLFHNVDDAGEPDNRAVHAGLPVRRGRKLILSKWIRANPLDLGGPPGRPF